MLYIIGLRINYYNSTFKVHLSMFHLSLSQFLHLIGIHLVHQFYLLVVHLMVHLHLHHLLQSLHHLHLCQRWNQVPLTEHQSALSQSFHHLQGHQILLLVDLRMKSHFKSVHSLMLILQLQQLRSHF